MAVVKTKVSVKTNQLYLIDALEVPSMCMLITSYMVYFTTVQLFVTAQTFFQPSRSFGKSHCQTSPWVLIINPCFSTSRATSYIKYRNGQNFISAIQESPRIIYLLVLPCLTSHLIVLLMAHCSRAHTVCANAEGVCPRTVPLTGNAIFMY